MIHRNQAQAFVSMLARVMSQGDDVTVRGSLTRELTQQVVQVGSPLERYVPVPNRRGDIFAAIAETVWVIAGRNDLAFLSEYLPRAAAFSDDGSTWRAGYGPRLRDWHGVDQISESVAALSSDRETRRAVISLFDPASDFGPSLDIPCTNWIHPTIRAGALHLDVAVRSNDLFWGFSGINLFEWSVLQEMLAYWLDCNVGQVSYWISSLHIYERHLSRAEQILSTAHVDRLLPEAVAMPRFSTPFPELRRTLDDWFACESSIRRGIADVDRVAKFPDPLLRDFLWMLRARALARDGDTDAGLQALDAVEDLNMRAAGQEFLTRASHLVALEPEDYRDVVAMVIDLHREKSTAYGSSWKRRGERFSILPNVARKVDRLAMWGAGAPMASETIQDTALDLLVYAIKYQTYLTDLAAERPNFGGQKWSDGPDGFEVLVRELDVPPDLAIADAIARVGDAYSRAERAADEDLPIAERQIRVAELIDASWGLVAAVRRAGTF